MGVDRLVDRCEGRRDVERKPEDRLARRPDDAFHAVVDRGLEDVVGRHGVDAKGLALGTQAGRRDGGEMDDRVSRGERVLGLAEIGQVGHQGLLGRVPVRAHVDVEDLVAVIAQVAHDPRSALAAAARDDDPHVRHLRAKYRLHALVAPDFSESSQVPGPPSGGGQPAHPDPRAQARPAAADVADRGCRDRRRAGCQRTADPGDVAASRRPRATLDDRRHPHRHRPGHGAVRHLPRTDPARADVTKPVARPGVRDGRIGRRAPVARLREPSGCCSATASSRPSATRSATGAT